LIIRMHASAGTKLFVGFFGIVGIIALAYLSMRLGRVAIVPGPGYVLDAKFDDVAGLKPGDNVEIAGVQVGKVASIILDGARARVRMRIAAAVQIDDEAIAAVKTAGIIGDKYVSISLGAGETTLADAAVIRETQSAFVLEDAIGKLLSNATDEDDTKDKGKDSGEDNGKDDG
jgi:phospholipid/cholesterol/gamma-HCH transport system substrate-binding protein